MANVNSDDKLYMLNTSCSLPAILSTVRRILFPPASIFNQKVGCADCKDKTCPRNLPNNILFIRFGDNFQQDINKLPSGMTGLILRGKFNKNIDFLPKSLKTLLFEDYSCFNQPVDNLPSGLTQLRLSNAFNQNIDHLPEDLEYLHFVHQSFFNQPVDNLPSSLTELRFGIYFNQSVDHLPKNLKILFLNFCFNKSLNNLPPALTHLTLGYSFDQNIDKLPSSLTHLTLGNSFNQNIEKLPSSLIYINFNGWFNPSIEHKLPKSVNTICFSAESKIKNYIPETVENVEITFTSNCSSDIIIDNLPANIKKVTINDNVKKHCFTKIPHDCKIYNFLGEILSC